MKKYTLLCAGLLLILFNGTCSHDVDKEFWAKTFSGTASENCYIDACQATGDDGCICVGTTYSPSTKMYSILIMKINSDGGVAWQKNYGGDVGGVATSIIRSSISNNYIVAGGLFEGEERIRQKTLLLSINEDGTILSQKTYMLELTEGPVWLDKKYDSSAGCLYQTNDGGIIVGGSTSDPDLIPSEAMLMLKIDRKGEPVWAKQYSKLALASVRSVFQTRDGGFLVAGNYTWTSKGGTGIVMKLDANGDIQWQKLTPLGSTAAPLYADSYIVAASSSKFYGPSNTLVFSLDFNGNVAWSYTLEGLETGTLKILQSIDSGYLIAGSFGYYPIDIWLAKLSKSGRFEWQSTIADSKSNVPGAILRTPGGAYIVAGSSQYDEGRQSDALLLKLDRTGNIPDCALVSQSTIISKKTAISLEDANVLVENLSATVNDSFLQLVDVGINETTLCYSIKDDPLCRMEY